MGKTSSNLAAVRDKAQSVEGRGCQEKGWDKFDVKRPNMGNKDPRCIA